MTREDFAAMQAAYFAAKHKAGHTWTARDLNQTEAAIADIHKHLFPPPKPVLVDYHTLQEAIETLEACDGNSIRTQQIIAALTKSTQGATT